ncbi:MAG: VWA domain-containing protein [Promethearchaeota archaeon]
MTLEDVVLLVDNSRSMVRSDFKPRRLSIALNIIRKFVKSKFEKNPMDRISLIAFNESAAKICDFSSDPGYILNSLRKIKISGKGLLSEGLAFSIQAIIEEMRKISGKIYSIVIITDCKYVNDLQVLNKFVEIAKGLGIYINACLLLLDDIPSTEFLIKLSKATNGFHEHVNKPKPSFDFMNQLIEKKEISTTVDFFSPNNQSFTPPLIKDIALPLRRPTLLEIRLMMSKYDDDSTKCQICHSNKSPITGGDFYSEGRFCPSCDRPIHISCASQWAKKSEIGKNIFRCPFCFFLLKLPESSLLYSEMNDNLMKEKHGSLIEKEITTRMILVSPEEVQKIDSSCNYCHGILLDDINVYKCENCGECYHEPCLEKIYQEFQACRNCGAKIIF